MATVIFAGKPGRHTSLVEERVKTRLQAIADGRSAAAGGAGAAAEEDGEDDTHGGWDVHDAVKKRKGGPKPRRR